jgi:glycosyltransferase involved in cell wall biosynthesis
VAVDDPHGPEVEVVVPEKTGCFFSSNDADSLAMHLVKLLAHPEMLREMGVNGRNLIQSQYGVQHMVEVFLQAFDYALRQRSEDYRNSF